MSRYAIMLLLAGALLVASGCEEEERGLYLGVYVPPAADPDAAGVGDVSGEVGDPAIPDDGPRSVCEPGAVMCLATSAREILRCEAASEETPALYRWRRDVCPGEEVCLEGVCQPFRCEPNRGACRGLTTRGMCNGVGDGLEGEELCEEGTTCRGGICVSACEGAAGNRSYIGCDYLVAELPNPLKTSLTTVAPFGVVVANPDPLVTAHLELVDPDGAPTRLQSEVLISGFDGDNRLQSTTVRSEVRFVGGSRAPLLETATRIALPPGAVATLLPVDRPAPSSVTGVFGVVRRLRSTQPVIAYQFNPYCCDITYTNDATILLPTTALGASYTSVGPPDLGALSAYVAVAAPEATRLRVTLPEGAELRPDLSGRLALPEGRLAAPATVEVLLASDELLLLSSIGREGSVRTLAGLRVDAEGPVAVFSGHECTFIPGDTRACDHMEQQLIPEDTWGRRYIAGMLKRRSARSSERLTWHLVAGAQPVAVRLSQRFSTLRASDAVVSGLPNCRDFLNFEGDTFSLPAHANCMLGSSLPFVMEGDQPFMVLGYLAGQDAAGGGTVLPAGDPSMFLLPPVEQFRSAYTFLTPDTYEHDFATLLIPREGLGTLSLDGRPLDVRAAEVEVVEVFGSALVVVHVPVSDGVHHLEASVPFGLIVYAYDRYVSYAYPGGLNLTKRK